MGLFKSKRKTHVISVTQRMLDDDNFKYSDEYAIHHYLQEQRTKFHIDVKDSSLVNLLLEYSYKSLPNKFNKAYMRAIKPNKYIFGIPTSATTTQPKIALIDALHSYLNTLEIAPVSMIYAFINEANLYHFSWLKLVDKYGYNLETNELEQLSQDKGFPCYLYSGLLTVSTTTFDEYSEIDNLHQYGLSMSHGECFDRTQDVSRIPDSYILGSDKDILTITYKYRDNTNTVIEESIDIELDINNDSDRDWIQALYTVNGKYKLFTYAYLTGGNPEIDSALNFQDALAEYYPRIYIRINQQNVVDLASDNRKKTDTINLLKILGMDLKDLTSELSKSIGGDYADVRYLYLTLGASINKNLNDSVISEYCYRYFLGLSQKGTSGLLQTISDNECTQTLYYNQLVLEDIDVVKTTKGKFITEYSSGIHSIYYQITDNSCKVIHIHGLTVSNMFSGHSNSHSGNDENLLIPLDRTVLPKLSNREKELLINKCLHIQINMIKVVKQKWYQSLLFKIFLAVVSIVITVATMGVGTPIATILKQIAINMLIGTAIGIAVGALAKVAVSLGLNPEVVGIISFVATMVAIAYGAKFDYSKIFTAHNIMKALNTTLEVTQKAFMLSMKTIQKEMDTFKQYALNQQDRLKKAQELLNTNIIPLDLELMTKPLSNLYINLGETVEEFYNRTMTVDVTYLTQVYIEGYVQMTTSLPTFRELSKPKEDTSIDDILLIT